MASPDALLCVSIVSYQPDPVQFALLLRSLGWATRAVQQAFGRPCAVQILDHSPDHAPVQALCAPFAAALHPALLHDPTNPGFGAGHNRSIRSSRAPFHLILNPDVILPADSLVKLLCYMQAHAEVAVLGPEVRNARGQLEFPCKQDPTVLDLLLRGFAPRCLQQRFAARLARYECRDLVLARHSAPARHLSGCFLLCRTGALQAVGGFDEGYFLYFEDFALCRALATVGVVRYCPDTYVVHHGGGAAHKGWRHLRYFAASAWRWFRQFGWRWW